MGMLMRRRYYQQKTEAAKDAGEESIASVFVAKRDQLLFTPFPVTFPGRKALLEVAENKYQGLEDVSGVPLETLTQVKGIGEATATQIIAQVDLEIAARAADKTALPDDFPARDILLAAGYTTLESLANHAAIDFEKITGITTEIAAQIITALTPAS
jgi:Helix-hairpin-helix domain